MIRVVLPAHLRTLAHVDGEVQVPVAGPVTQRAVLDALETRYPDAARNDPGPAHAGSAGRSSGSSPASRTCRTSRRTRRCPDAVAAGTEPFLIVGAMAGG